MGPACEAHQRLFGPTKSKPPGSLNPLTQPFIALGSASDAASCAQDAGRQRQVIDVHRPILCFAPSVARMSKSPRANTLPLLTSVTMNPLEAGVEYLDANGVLRRSTSVSKRMQLRGVCVGSSDNLFKCSDGDVVCEPAVPNEDVMAEDKTAEELRQQQKKIDIENKKKMVIEKRDRKREFNAQLIKTEDARLQLWHDTLEADLRIETTAVRNNGPESPSRKALSYVDAHGNLRRHRAFSGDSSKSTDGSSAGSPAAQSPVYLQTSTPKKQQQSSSVWSFVLGKADPLEQPFSEV